MKFINYLPRLSVLSVAVLLAACNSDTILSPNSPTAVNPNESPSSNFNGRYQFNAQEFTALDSYNQDLGFEINDTNGARFIADALNRVIDNDLSDLESLVFSRLTGANQFFEEQNGLEPLFDSGFKLRARNCKGGGTSSIELFDSPLNFLPNANDSLQVRFSDCKDPVNDTVSILTQGDTLTFIKKYEGRFSQNEPVAAQANFSDLFSEKQTVLNEDKSVGGSEVTGRQDYAVTRSQGRQVHFIATENIIERTLNADDEVLAEFGEVSQQELTKITDSNSLLRFQVLRFAPSQTQDVLSSKYSSEEGRTVSPTTAVKVGSYQVAGDPYHPNNSVPGQPPRTGLTEGGMVALGKNGKIELVFNQEPVQGFTNIVRVIKTAGTTTTHDCKVPYFSVYRSNGTADPRFSFAANGVCLVDGQPFPPQVEPPPPPPPPVETCFVRDIVNTVQENDPSPLTSALGVVLTPATDALCMVVGAIPVPIPTP